MISKEIKEAILKEYNGNYGHVKYLAKKYNLRYPQIYPFIKRHFPSGKSKQIWTKDKINDIVNRYNKGESINEIATNLELSESSLRMALYKQGISLRKI